MFTLNHFIWLGIVLVIIVSLLIIQKVRKISFDKETERQISNAKVFSSSCMKECVEAKPFNELVQRIVLPIYHMNNRLGVIVVLTKQKTRLNIKFLEIF